MTSRRAQAYGRVMETLRSAGEARLQTREEDQLREAADTLLFCDDTGGPDARIALDQVRQLTAGLVTSGRWTRAAADRLLEDVAACGPVLLLV
jgi:hypothetical protein